MTVYCGMTCLNINHPAHRGCLLNAICNDTTDVSVIHQQILNFVSEIPGGGKDRTKYV